MKKHALTPRYLLVCSALLLLAFANGAFARGAYQRAEDGKTLVWNEYPGRGEAAAWSGARDSDGYARGEGALTWYRVEKPNVTGSNIPSDRRGHTAVFARYTGKMVRGKFDGPVVRVDPDGRAIEAMFVDGTRSSEWVVASAPQTARRGDYQRATDGKTLVWNEYPGLDYEASWTGARDPNGYSSGEGTLTWYRFDRPIVTGSNIPSERRERTIVVSRYSGKMRRGKFDGPVERVDADGRTFHAAFVNGSRAGEWAEGPITAAGPQERPTKRVQKTVAEVPARPASSPGYRRAELVEAAPVAEAATVQPPTVQASPAEASPAETPAAEAAAAETPAAETRGAETRVTETRTAEARTTETPAAEAPAHGDIIVELFRPPSSLRGAPATASARAAATPSQPTVPVESPPTADQDTKNNLVTEFKEHTKSILSHVSNATRDFQQVDRLESIQRLPMSVSQGISSLADQARALRSRMPPELVPAEADTVDALSVADQIARDVGANESSTACSRAADFVRAHREPRTDAQKPLWRYLMSIQTICGRSGKEAQIQP